MQESELRRINPDDMFIWFNRLSRNERYLIVSLLFLIVMLILNWTRVAEGFMEGLEKFGITESKRD